MSLPDKNPIEIIPDLAEMPRVDRDVTQCLKFIARHPWGKPLDRARDIYRGYARIQRGPLLNPIKVRRRSLGLELRRHNAAQFAIIYAYVKPNEEFPRGLVSIRAVRHARVRDVFSGVREQAPPPHYFNATTSFAE